MSKELSDLEVVQDYYKVSSEMAQKLIDMGVDIDMLKAGPTDIGKLPDKLNVIQSKMEAEGKKIVDDVSKDLSNF